MMILGTVMFILFVAAAAWFIYSLATGFTYTSIAFIIGTVIFEISSFFIARKAEKWYIVEESKTS